MSYRCNDTMHRSYVRIEKSDGKKTWRVIPKDEDNLKRVDSQWNNALTVNFSEQKSP